MLTFTIARPTPTVPPPSTEVDNLENQLIEVNKGLSLKKLSIKDSNFPVRPGYGTLGEKVTLRTNYFHLLAKKEQKIHLYSVNVEPEGLNKRKKRRLFELLLATKTMMAHQPGVASDYASNLITTKALDLGPEKKRIAPIQYYDAEQGRTQPNPTDKSYNVKIEFTRTMALSELLQYLSSNQADASCPNKAELIQALNIAMCKTANAAPGVTAVSGNKFFPSDTPAPGIDLTLLGSGLVALRGYYMSVRTATLRVLLNVNVCTMAFYKSGSLVDLVLEYKGDAAINPMFLRDLNRFLKGLRVKTSYLKDSNNRPYTRLRVIFGLCMRPLGANANQATFMLKDPKTQQEKSTSVNAFFKQGA
jgi:eukaryotic translation initiation factor 2C